MSTKTSRTFTVEDLDLIRQWFDCVQDVNPVFLDARDFELASRIHDALGLAKTAEALRSKKPVT